MKKKQNNKSQTIIDHEHISTMIGLDQNVALKILIDFISDSIAMQNKLADAIAVKDIKNIEFYAHKIQGATANIGGELSAHCAASIESCASQQDIKEISEKYSNLKSSLDLLRQEVRAVTQTMTCEKEESKSNEIKFQYPEKILCVDDDPSYSKQLKRIAELCGYEGIEINDPTHCDEYFQEPLAMVLLDYSMKSISGTEILKSIRKIEGLKFVPIIMVTSKVEEDFIVNCLESGANDYINKPLNIKVSKARIQTHLDNFQLQSQRMKEQELDTIKSLVVTYNHEINNPLSVAVAYADMIKNGHHTESHVEKLVDALNRITSIIRSIKELTEKTEINKESYAEVSESIKLSN